MEHMTWQGCLTRGGMSEPCRAVHGRRERGVRRRRARHSWHTCRQGLNIPSFPLLLQISDKFGIESMRFDHSERSNPNRNITQLAVVELKQNQSLPSQLNVSIFVWCQVKFRDKPSLGMS